MLALAPASCVATLTSHLPTLQDVVAALLERETLEGAEVARIVAERLRSKADAAQQQADPLS